MNDLGPGLDLGHGHWLRWASWSPDRELNPQYAGIPDIERAVALIRHDLRPDDPQEYCRQRGWCEGAAHPDTPETRAILHPDRLWQVLSWDPLTLHPSLKCHCGDHGHIREGRWVPA